MKNLFTSVVKAFRLNHGDDIDKSFLESYRKILFGQYQSLDAAGAKREAEAVTALNDRAHWDDLYRLELALIKLEPGDLLRRKVWILRQEFKELASADEVKEYYASNPPDPMKADEPVLRADCIRLQEELNWRYVVAWVLEDYRASLTRGVLKWAGVFLIFMLALSCASMISWVEKLGSGLNLQFFALTIGPGVIGGLVSTLRRIQTAKLEGNADMALTQLDKNNAGVLLSPFFGGLFAFLLFALVCGGFLTGSLFPKIGFENLVGGAITEIDYSEIAKLVVWSFIAGFSERLVPDRLGAIADESASGGAQAPAKPKTTAVVVAK